MFTDPAMSLPTTKRIKHLDPSGVETPVDDDRWEFMRRADPTLKVCQGTGRRTDSSKLCVIHAMLGGLIATGMGLGLCHHLARCDSPRQTA